MSEEVGVEIQAEKTQNSTPDTERLSFNDHKLEVLHHANEFRRSNHLCDVVIEVQGREFPAHRSVLAAGGGFFRGLFAASMREQTESKVQLQHVDPDVMNEVLSFIYTGEIELSRDNAQLILIAADFLLLDRLKTSAEAFFARVIKDLPSSDYLSIFLFAIRYNCPVLKREALKLVIKHFEAVSATQELLELSVETLKDIISSDALVVSKEEVVFETILKWVNHQESRKSLFYELFSQVRLNSLSSDFIDSTVKAEHLVSSNPECQKLIRMNRKCYDLNAPGPHPRDCLDKYTNAIVAFATWDVIEQFQGGMSYVPREDKYYEIPVKFDNCWYGYGQPVYNDGCLYLVKPDDEYLIIDCFIPMFKMWYQAAARKTSLIEVGSACLKGVIYIVGGEVDRTPRKMVYRYDTEADPEENTINTIHTMKPLAVARSSPCVVADENYLYVIGGYTHNWRTCTACGDGPCLTESSVERYQPETKAWTFLSPMRSNASTTGTSGCAVMNGKIFVSCFSPLPKDLNTVDVYDIDTDEWSLIPEPIPCPSKQCPGRNLIALDNEIYHICAFSNPTEAPRRLEEGERYYNDITVMHCVFDVANCTWSQVSSVQFRRQHNSLCQWGPRPLDIEGVAVRLDKEYVGQLNLLNGK